MLVVCALAVEVLIATGLSAGAVGDNHWELVPMAKVPAAANDGVTSISCTSGHNCFAVGTWNQNSLPVPASSCLWRNPEINL